MSSTLPPSAVIAGPKVRFELGGCKRVTSERLRALPMAVDELVSGSLVMSGAAQQPQGFLVRVKRLRGAEPLPELVVEAPQLSAGKRRRVGVAPATLRLVDSVGAGQWSFQEGLPSDWSKAASAASASSAAERRQPREVRNGAPPWASWQAGVGGATPVLQEAARRVVAGAAGEAVQLVDVEAANASAPAPAPVPAAAMLSGFLIDGQPLIATPSPVVPASSSEAPLEEDGDFVWDVYAPSDGVFAAPGDGSAALLRLAAPFLEEEDMSELEDFGDIDDDSSDAGSSSPTLRWGGAAGDAGSAARACRAGGFPGGHSGRWGGGGSSSDEDAAWDDDPAPNHHSGRWVDVLD